MLQYRKTKITTAMLAGVLAFVAVGQAQVELTKTENFTTGFETVEGYSSGYLQSDPIWSLTGSSYPYIGEFGLNGTLGLELDALSGMKIDFLSSAAVPVGWVDFYVKPAFGGSEDLPVSFPLGRAALTGFVRVDGEGEIFALHGDGEGNGVWLSSGYLLPLDGNIPFNWLRMTYRLDYTNQRWDLYVDDALQMIDLGFVDANAPPLTAFGISGGSEGPTLFDEFEAGFVNPLFEDADNDGIEDAYEIGQGLSTSMDDRGGDLDLDGLANIFEYMNGLAAGNADTDGDGVHDGRELAEGSDPLSSQPYALALLPFVEDFESLVSGPLASQTSWELAGTGMVEVNDLAAYGGIKSMTLTADAEGDVSVSRDFDGSGVSEVWLDFRYSGALFNAATEIDTADLDPKSSTVFWLTDANTVKVLDGDGIGGGIWKECPFNPSAEGWERITVKKDYAAQTFSLWMNGVRVARDFGFVTVQPYFDELRFRHQGDEISHIDEITVGFTRPFGLDTDGDGLTDEAEDLNGNGVLDPGETDPQLADTDGDGLTDGAGVGLKLWLRSDQGVEADSQGAVEAWRDLSQWSNDATQTTALSRPQVVANAYGENPAVRFDGLDDFLGGNSAFNASSGDFTMIVVHRKAGGHELSAPFSYCTSVSAYGAPLLRWGPEANNFGINEVGYGADGVYLDLGADHAEKLFIASVRREGGNAGGLNGALSIRALAHNEGSGAEGIQTWTSGDTSGFYIGKKRSDSDHMFGGDVLEVRMYDGALTEAQMRTVEQQIASRYGMGLDLDLDGLPDDWEVATFDSFEFGPLDDPDGDGLVNLREMNLQTDANAPDSFDPIQGHPNLRLWLDASQPLVLDDNGAIESWTDLSGWNESASQSDPLKRPAFVLDGFAGKSTVSFDGTDDFLEGATAFDPGAGDFTIIAVARQNPTNGLSAALSYSTSDEALGAPLLRWNRPESGDIGINDVGRGVDGVFVEAGDSVSGAFHLISVTRSGGDADGLNAALQVRALADLKTLTASGLQSWASGPSEAYFIGRKKTTADGNNDLFDGEVAEILVFDRALSQAELREFEERLGASYGIDLDVDADGLADAEEYAIFGDLSQAPSGDFDGDGLSNARELNLGMDPATANGLNTVLSIPSLSVWLKAGEGVQTDATGAVDLWSDRSGYGRTIFQSEANARPTLATATVNGHPAVRFDGVNDFLLGDAGFNAGAGDFTILAVHRRAGGHEKAALLSFNLDSGATGAPLLRWGPDADHIGINDVGVGPAGLYDDLIASTDRYFITAVTRSGGDAGGSGAALSLLNHGYNGRFETTGTQTWTSADASVFALGKKNAGSGHFLGGDIAEVLIFEEALDAETLAQLQNYLVEKYNLVDDIDGDGLTNAEEDTNLNFIVDPGETDPQAVDTDGDSMVDSLELRYGLDPLVADASEFAALDPISEHWSTEFSFAEGYIEGALDGQLQWSASGNVAVASEELVEVESVAQTVSNFDKLFGAGDRRQIWLSFRAKLIVGEMPDPLEFGSFGGLAFGYGAPNRIALWYPSLGDWQSLSVAATGDEWNEYALYLDYEAGTWDLVINGVLVTEGLSLGSDPAYTLSQFMVAQQGPEEAADPQFAQFDDLTLAVDEPVGLDFDGDGLDNATERTLGSNLYSGDTDGDGMPDLWEYENGLNLLSNDSGSDQDGDGLSNSVEYEFGIDPNTHDREGVAGAASVEYWDAVYGNEIVSLTSNSRFPLNPTGRTLIGSLTTENNDSGKSHFGQRIRGTITAPVTGDYTFWIASDDESELWLSLNETPFEKRLASSVSKATGYHQWDKYVSQRSVKIPLEAGNKYYFEILHKEGSGKDHVAVAWEYPGQARRVIHSDVLTSAITEQNDLDEDGLQDDWESSIGLDATKGHGANGYAGDADGDGLSNYQERDLNTNPMVADTDGDGISDFDEIKTYFGDPLVQDIGARETSLDISLSDGFGVKGDWSADAFGVFSKSSSGIFRQPISISEAGQYELELVAQPKGTRGIVSSDYELVVYVDGEYVSGVTLKMPEGSSAENVIVLPWLDAGEHVLDIRFINFDLDRNINFSSLSIHRRGGADLDDNGRPDWVDHRLALHNGIESTTYESQVSPFCLEGRSRYPGMIALDGSTSATPAPADRWYANLQLDANQSVTGQVFFENGGYSEEYEVNWVETNIIAATGSTFRIREGDSLLLNAYPTGVTDGDISISMQGEPTITSTVDSAVPVAFETSGTYVIDGQWSDGTQTFAGQIFVEVVRAEFSEAPIVMVGQSRVWKSGVLSDVAIEFDSRSGFSELVPNTTTGERVFAITTDSLAPRYFASRLSADGPILDSQKISGLRAATTSATGYRLVEMYEDGTGLYEVSIVLSDVYPTTEVHVDIFVSGVMFDDGSRYKVLNYEDFNSNGLAHVYFIIPGSAKTSICHRTNIYDGNVKIGKPGG